MTASFRQLLAEFLPRILSQCCRDANSPSFGCFDRYFWHYRMRDFSSIILQQGGYAVLLAQKALPDAPVPKDCTPPGMETDWRASQNLNAVSPMLVTPEGIVMSASFSQP